MTCLACGNESLSSMYSGVRDRYGVAAGSYSFLRCHDCGSATLDPMPTPQQLALFYPDDYTFKRADSYSGLRGMMAALEWKWFYLPGYRRRARALLSMTGLARGRLLEVGCGSGLFLGVVRELGWDAEGVEPSGSDVRHAREKLGLRVTQGSVEDVIDSGGGFDVVIAVYVLEHIPSPLETLRTAFNLLRPGGKVIMGLPMIDSLQSRLLRERWSAVTEAPRHVFIPSMKGAQRLLERAGFRNVGSAATPLIENAGHVALSFLPSAATPATHRRRGSAMALLSRLAGAALLVPGVAIAGLERLGRAFGTCSGTMFVVGEKS